MTDRRILVDWICYGAETDWWACWRPYHPPWSRHAMTWAEWHVLRCAATGDVQELMRAARHVLLEIPA